VVLRSERGLRPLLRRLAGVGVWAALALGLALPVAGQTVEEASSSAGARILNRAVTSFQIWEGGPQFTAADSVAVLVGDAPGVFVTPPRATTSWPGSRVLFSHSITNTWSTEDDHEIEVSSTAGWPIQLYHDVDGNGVLSLADTLLTGAAPAGTGSPFWILVAIDIPGTAVGGSISFVDVTARSLTVPTRSGTVRNTVTIRNEQLTQELIQLRKEVDHAEAPPGEILTYTLRIDNYIDGAAHLRVEDPLPRSLEYIPGSMRLDGVPVTDREDLDVVAFDPETRTVRIEIPRPSVGVNTLTFRARVSDQAPVSSSIDNRASLNLGFGGFGAITGSATATTRITDTCTQVEVAPCRVEIRKEIIGPASAKPGERVGYRIEVWNTSTTLRALDLRVVDVLPAALVPVHSIPQMDWGNGPYPTWEIDALEPGERRSIEVWFEVGAVDLPSDIVNVVRLEHESGSTQTVSAPPITLIPLDPLRASIEKSVDRRDAAPGDRLRYSIRATAFGDGDLRALILRDTLPAGLTLLPQSLEVSVGSASGSSVATLEEREGVLTLHWSEPARGEELHLTFLAEIDPSITAGLILNRAFVELHSENGASAHASAEALTRISSPELQILKWVSGPNPAVEGDTLRYIIEVTNSSTSATTAAGLIVADTLPVPLRAVSIRWGMDSAPVAVGAGAGRSFRWAIPALLPGESFSFEVTTVVDVIPDAMEVRNRAYLLHHERPIGIAESGSIALVPTDPAAITLALVSERVELFQGERLPLVATLRNAGDVSVSELRIEITIPEGLRWIPQVVRAVFGAAGGTVPANFLLPNRSLGPSIPGQPGGAHAQADDYPIVVDSVEVIGNKLLLHLPGDLAPGQDFRVAFELLVLGGAGRELLIEAIAEGRRGTFGTEAVSRVVAAQAVAIQARTERSELETRMVLGRVFLDLNGDGIQQEGEPGVGAVEIWTADGEVVRTDAHGSFSLQDLRPGRHLLRIDPLSLPADMALTRGNAGAGAAFVELSGWSSARASFPLSPIQSEEAPLEGGEVPDSETAEAGEPSPLSVAPLRSEEERVRDGGANFLTGPGVQIFTPMDGLVSGTNRFYLGVRGEPGAPVRLFRDAEWIADATLRPDGVQDFVGLELHRGPQHFRVEMRNSWGQLRQDSIAIHYSGEATELRPEHDRVTLVADGRTSATLRVLVLDEWGVPVAENANVTVFATEARIVSRDDDHGSVGVQLSVDRHGWIAVELVGGTTTTQGELRLSIGEVVRRIPIDINPEIRPLFLTGAAHISLGAGGESSGAVTARGRLDDRTAITLGYDSRRLDQGRAAFNRSSDPLAENRYPVTGDTSEQRSVLASRYAFYGKIEREQSWLLFGDITEGWFSQGLGMARYSRAVPGVALQAQTGAVSWNGFAASTSQTLVQREFRGSGVSGPFQLGGDVLPGTERITIEARDRANPTRVLNREELRRFMDYEISHEQGLIVLRRPLPAEDLSGNLLFLVISYEGEGAGQEVLLGGVRGAVDLGPLLGGSALRAPVALSLVHDAQRGREFTMAAVNAEVSAGGALFRGEAVHAALADSSDVALRIEASIPLLAERLQLSTSWMRVGEEFTNPSNSSARAGAEELRARAAFAVPDTRLAVAYEEQEFLTSSLARRRTSLEAIRKVLGSVEVGGRLADERSEQSGSESSTLAGEAEVRWQATERLSLFAEGRDEFRHAGAPGTMGSFLGGGASLRLLPSLSIEGRHQYVVPREGDSYSLLRFGVNADPLPGTRGWGGYDRASGGEGLVEGTVVGLSHQFRLGEAWGLQAMLERRDGVAMASPSDPVRGTPFTQEERDYLSLGAGIEFLPADRPYRLSLRGETKQEAEGSAHLLLFASEARLTQSLGVLTRQEFREDARPSLTGSGYSRNRSSLLGVAYRPTFTDALNILGRFEFRDAVTPAGRSIQGGERRESKVIGSLEAIWTPRSGVEVGGRIASKNSEVTTVEEGRLNQIRSRTRFLGSHLQVGLSNQIGVRVTARGAFIPEAAHSAWDIAPALVVSPFGGLQVEAGYRFGELHDPDFAIRSGEGWYASFGIQVTESTLSTVTEFWRSRIQ